MVKITGFTLDLTRADLSMMPSLRCNITCSFCMYDCGPTSKERLDLDDTKAFLATVDWSKVAGRVGVAAEGPRRSRGPMACSRDTSSGPPPR